MRPAESALRRLIVIAARDVVVAPRAARAFPEGLELEPPASEKVGCFALFDPRLHPAPPAPPVASAPNIRFLDEPAGAKAAMPDAPVNARALTRRLARLRRSLENLQGEAKRLARWRLRHASDVRRPMRPGRPPGHRHRPHYEIDRTLRELQTLALLSYVDTS